MKNQTLLTSLQAHSIVLVMRRVEAWLYEDTPVSQGLKRTRTWEDRQTDNIDDIDKSSSTNYKVGGSTITPL